MNGIPIFAKGANWIPIDSFESRSSVDTVYNLLKVLLQKERSLLVLIINY